MTLLADTSPAPSGTLDPAARRERRLAIGGLAVTQVIGWGTTFYPIAIIGRAVSTDLGLSRGVVYGGLTVMLTVSALLSPRIGARLDRDGARKIMCLGSLAGFAALALLSQAQGIIAYGLAWALVGLTMPMALGMAAFTAATQIMGSDARKAITTLTFFTGIASTVFWPVTEAMSAALGWRAMLLIFAGLHLFVCLPIHFKVLPSRSAHRSRLSRPASPPEQGVLPVGQRRQGFALMAAASALHGLVGWGLALHFIELFKTMGLPAASAVAIASLNGVMQISARGGEVLSGGRHSPVLTGVIAVAMQPVAFFGLLAFGASNLTALLFIVGYGLSAGLMTIARAALPLWLFGRAAYGAYSGRLNQPQNLIFGAAPLVFALVIDRFGPMTALWTAFAASAGATIAMAYLARLAGMREAETDAASATE